MSSARRVIRWALLAVGVGVVAVVGVTVVNLRRLPSPPLPPGAEALHLHWSPLGLSRQWYLAMSNPYPSLAAVEHYTEWANAHGWLAVAPDQDRWSGWEWESFVDATTDRPVIVDQYLASWASPHHNWSLRVALRHFRETESSERSDQRIAVWVVPFSYVDPPG